MQIIKQKNEYSTSAGEQSCNDEQNEDDDEIDENTR